MRRTISTKVIDGQTGNVIFSDTNPLDITDKTTVAEVITALKALITKPLDIDTEKFYCGNDELKKTDIVPNTTGNELEITTKKLTKSTMPAKTESTTISEGGTLPTKTK
jgi:hypothetical protein